MLISFKRINDIRVDNDITVKEMAEILDISPNNYYDYEHARSNFPLDKLNTFVNYFKVSFDYILLKQLIIIVRKENKLSQSMVAKIFSDRQSTYWNYEKGKSNIPISKLYLLAKFYNISIDYFVGKTDKRAILTEKKFVK